MTRRCSAASTACPIPQDTEMLLATAKSIIKRELFDIKTLSEDLAGTFSKGQGRAYPETLSVLLPQLQQGLVCPVVRVSVSSSHTSGPDGVHNSGRRKRMGNGWQR